MPGERDHPPACVPSEEPLADLDALSEATRAFITAHDSPEPAVSAIQLPGRTRRTPTSPLTGSYRR